MTSKLVPKLLIGLLGFAPLLALAAPPRALPAVKTVKKVTAAPKPIPVPVSCRNCGEFGDRDKDHGRDEHHGGGHHGGHHGRGHHEHGASPC